jgi:8-oxo-dGTP diphosphatase
MKVVRVVAALLPLRTDATRFLVQQRLPGKSRELLWEFPGGKVEPGEDDERALIRECKEELGVELQIGQRLWSTIHRYPDLTVELVLYAAKIEKGEPQCLGAHELRYLTPQQMRELPFCEADLPLLEALASQKI